MISGIGSQINQTNTLASLNAQKPQAPDENLLQLKEKFQDFVAGTFYKQMFKSLRKTHDKAAYINGGQAEEMFQNQLDQQVAEDLARDHGGSFADDLFEAFKSNLRL